jgi:hypothetical protein
MSCLSLGTLKTLLAPSTRRAHLQRGLDILLRLKQADRLHTNWDNITLFEKEIRKIDAVLPTLWPKF